MLFRAHWITFLLGLDNGLSMQLMLLAIQLSAHEMSGKFHLGGIGLFIPEIPRLESFVCTGITLFTIPVPII